MKDQISTILNREMDRREFLKYIATFALMIFGGSVILQSLGNISPGSSSSRSQKYGSNTYGGK